MPRWRLVISGRVQTAGYRAMVKNIAIGLQVKGTARNLDDGTVEIYCEASPDNFEQFREAIEVKADPRDLIMPNVANVKVHDENTIGYGKAPPDFKGFKIDYSGLDPQLETLERSEMGIIALGAVRNEVRLVGHKVDGVGQKIDDMHIDMNTRFDTLDTKYGEISKKMNELTAELHRSTDALVEMTQKVGAIIDKKLAE
jgi:acylphosphatase